MQKQRKVRALCLCCIVERACDTSYLEEFTWIINIDDVVFGQQFRIANLNLHLKIIC